MVLDSLSGALSGALRKLTKAGVVDESLIKELVKDIQKALLLSDVNVKLVFELSKNIESRAMEEKLPKGVSRKEHIIKIVYEELSRFMGSDIKKEHLPDKKGKVVLMIGIQGSGKTTTTGKLARFYQKRGFRVGVVGADTWRPGAFEQLKQFCAENNIPVFGDPKEKDSIKLAREGVKFFKEKTSDIIIVDTAGRHREEKGLIEEMTEISNTINPDEVTLVIDGTIGQQAFVQAEGFANATAVGSIIVTKLDGSAKGGGALSAAAATGAPIKFIGTGERIDSIEPFDPKRFVSRLLGLGDLETLLEKVKEASEAEDYSKLDKDKILAGKFDLFDMYSQLEMVSKMGPLKQVLSMIPGMGANLPTDMVEVGEEKLTKFRIIMDSMTMQEKKNPKIINHERIRRISRGSGTNQGEVKELLNQYTMIKKFLKGMNKRQLRGMKGKMPIMPPGFEM
ncbi:MAG: signal recognition particle protein Srp54 [Methanofastidiosum sp.]|jgi:signal recognition particle subunit SRP54|nr:signal recognition particle protein Srp54 [Methanofastidiosum sp.]